MSQKLATWPVISPIVQTNLEAIALSEGLLSRDDYRYRDLHEIPKRFGVAPGFGNPRTLLCFYPNLVSTNSDFSLAGLSEKSGLKIRTIEPRLIRTRKLMGLENQLSEGQFKALMFGTHCLLENIFSAQRIGICNVIDSHASQTWDDPTEKSDFTGNLQSSNVVRKYCERNFDLILELFEGWYDGDHSAPPFQAPAFERMLHEALNVPPAIRNHPYFDAWLDKFDEIYVRTVGSIFYSELLTKNLLSGPWKSAPSTTVGVQQLDLEINLAN